jgi:hypothetical protein
MNEKIKEENLKKELLRKVERDMKSNNNALSLLTKEIDIKKSKAKNMVSRRLSLELDLI